MKIPKSLFKTKGIKCKNCGFRFYGSLFECVEVINCCPSCGLNMKKKTVKRFISL